MVFNHMFGNHLSTPSDNKTFLFEHPDAAASAAAAHWLVAKPSGEKTRWTKFF